MNCELGEQFFAGSRIPDSCSSPGWKIAPQDVIAVLGGNVTFRCHTVLHFSLLLWTQNGKMLEVSSPSSKFSLSDHNRTLSYGPVGPGDDDWIIGCTVKTPFGLLPSPVGKITIKCKSTKYNDFYMRKIVV